MSMLAFRNMRVRRSLTQIHLLTTSATESFFSFSFFHSGPEFSVRKTQGTIKNILKEIMLELNTASVHYSELQKLLFLVVPHGHSGKFFINIPVSNTEIRCQIYVPYSFSMLTKSAGKNTHSMIY